MIGYLLQHRETIWQPAAPGSYVPVERTGQPLTWWTHQSVAEIARECLPLNLRRRTVVTVETIPADLQATHKSVS